MPNNEANDSQPHPKSGSGDDGGNYEVGYGHPPKHSRFQKGKSGNPKGRPKGKQNLATVLDKELQSKVVINENGRRKSVTKLAAVVKQLVNKAATGDVRSFQYLINLVQSGLVNEATTSPLSSEVDELIKRDLLKRLRAIPKEQENG